MGFGSTPAKGGVAPVASDEVVGAPAGWFSYSSLLRKRESYVSPGFASLNPEATNMLLLPRFRIYLSSWLRIFAILFPASAARLLDSVIAEERYPFVTVNGPFPSRTGFL
jgi:hypothetical protein